jgi:hypothetical protein
MEHSPAPFEPLRFILTAIFSMIIPFLLGAIFFNERLFHILERWVAARYPAALGSSPSPRHRRRARDYLVSYEFWLGGVLCGALFFLLGLIVKCQWFKW